MTLSLSGNAQAAYCPARWRTITALAEARGDRLIYTPPPAPP
ncbi:hypothetical protein [Thermomonospora echinospora]|nr:hypothetical protein [Thermomonospora echinospora]